MRDAATGDLALAARTDDDPDRYTFATAEGVCSPDAFRPPELLLAEVLWDRSPGHLLVPEANYGVVGTLIADAATSVTMTESSARAAGLCRRNARRNDVDANVSLHAELASLRTPGDDSKRVPAPPFDAVAYAPKPYAPVAVGRQRITDAMALLAPGDRCFVAAESRTGLARYRETLERIGDDAATVAERDGVVAIAATCPASLDTGTHSDRPQFVEPRVLDPTVDGIDLELVSVPGLFAADGLDHGTRLLLEHLGAADGARVLDACCGYGPVGAYAAASADCSVVLTDDDRVATRCAECSLRRTRLAPNGETTVVTGDCIAAVADRRFDLVATNPPTHAGSGVLAELFAGIHDVLRVDGECLFVRHGALDLSGHLRAFRSIETVATGEEHVVRRAVP